MRSQFSKLTLSCTLQSSVDFASAGSILTRDYLFCRRAFFVLPCRYDNNQDTSYRLHYIQTIQFVSFRCIYLGKYKTFPMKSQYIARGNLETFFIETIKLTQSKTQKARNFIICLVRYLEIRNNISVTKMTAYCFYLHVFV